MFSVTKEDKDVAIRMWESIRDVWLRNPTMPLSRYKYAYLNALGYEDKWSNMCLLCEYYAYNEDGSNYLHAACIQCPLHTCAEIGSQYYMVVSGCVSWQDRIDACNEIIAAIKNLKERGNDNNKRS